MMKRTFELAFLMILISSCAGNIIKEDPDDITVGKTVLSVNLGSGHTWTGQERIGVSGSIKGSNVLFVPYSSSIGKIGSASVYGGPVDGILKAYYPYGTQIPEEVPEYQTFCMDGYSQLYRNSLMTGTAEGTEVSLSYKAGVLHVQIAMDVEGNVKSVVLITPERSITLNGIGCPSSESKPLDVWFVIEPGEYDSLSMTVVSDKETMTKPLAGKYLIEAGKICDSKLEDKANQYDGSDIEEIGGQYDED